MSRVVVLMASHINVPVRIETMKQAINSVLANTIQPDVMYISYSIDSKIKEALPLDWPSHIQFIEQPQRLLQFQHYKELSKLIMKDDIVMFLDDDDLYTVNKIELSVIAYMAVKKPVRHYYAIFGLYNEVLTNDFSIMTVNEQCEYWTLTMSGHDFKQWFSLDCDTMKIDGFTDCSFATFFGFAYIFTKEPLILIRQEHLLTQTKRDYNF